MALPIVTSVDVILEEWRYINKTTGDTNGVVLDGVVEFVGLGGQIANSDGTMLELLEA